LFLNFIPTFINIYHIHSSFRIFLAVYPCFAFQKYTGVSKFPFQALHTAQQRYNDNCSTNVRVTRAHTRDGQRLLQYINSRSVDTRCTVPQKSGIMNMWNRMCGPPVCPASGCSLYTVTKPDSSSPSSDSRRHFRGRK
jgi:hypothetical protein